MAFLLDRLKDRIGGEEDEEKGFDDLNYVIGNSSAMDRGEVPTPLGERIGYASQIGGELMELQITNPATFSLEGDDMISAISQLGIDVTLHPDMNAGFTTAYKSGEAYGYDTVEDYFTQYIQELAYFKKRVERLGEGGPLFNIGRMNPHISTSPLPSLSERMARDVGLDIFGFEIAEFSEGIWKERNRRGQNIYKNPEFLRKFYKTFVAQELGENEYQYFQNFYTSFSNEFDKAWREKQNEVLNKMYDTKTGENGSETKDKIDLLSTASMRENVATKWLEILAEDVSKFDKEIENPLETERRGITQKVGPSTISSLEDLDRLISDLSQRYRLSQLRTLPEIYYFIESGELTRMADRNKDEVEEILVEHPDFIEDIKSEFMDKIPNALDRLWKAEPRKENEETKASLISVQGKMSAMVREMEIPDNRVQELTFKEHKDELREEVAELFAGEDKDYFEDDETEEIDWKQKHRRFLQSFGRNFEQQMWMESNLFYKIMPAWMSAANLENEDGHEGWEAPKFIWETLILDQWNEKEDVNIDLEDPWQDESDKKGYFDLLENDREFQMDVAAAVGACYCWAHYTQRKVQFNLRDRDYGLSEEEAEEAQNEGWTWIKWMNKFGLGVNLETMVGGPQQKFKVWRPKDIAVAAHAINMTAQEELEEINEELDGCPAKFTIDMEHVASMGVPPTHEMELFFDQEEKLAEEAPELNIPEEKPVSKIMRQMHLMDPGVDAERGTYHGAFDRGNTLLYEWLYRFVEEGFARNGNEPATILFELAEHKGESSYMMRVTMDLIEIGVEPEDLDPARVDAGEKPESEEEALIARFFGIDRSNYSREWTKIEEHAFDPLEGLLEAEQFDHTFSGKAALDNENRPNEWMSEEYK